MNLPVIDLDALGGGSGTDGLGFKFTATNYADLLTKVGMIEGDLGIVFNSQGVWLVNRKLKGVYIYQSGVWEYANQELQDRLAAKLDSVVAGDNIVVDNTDPLNPIINYAAIPFFSSVNTNQVSTSSDVGLSYNAITWNGLENGRTYEVFGMFICGCNATNRSVFVDVQSGGVDVYPLRFEQEPKDTDNIFYEYFSFVTSPVAGQIDVDVLFGRTAGPGGSTAIMYYSSLNIELKF